MNRVPLTFGLRLLLFYNKLFSWRLRKQSKDGWQAHGIDDEAGQFRYADYRCADTPNFVKRFGTVDFRGKTVLDFGSGHGGSTVWFARQGTKKVIGVDVDARVLEISGRYLKHVDPKGELPIEIRKGDRVRVPVEDGTIDCLMSMDVVEHVQDPAAILAEWQRVLSPTGRAYVSFGPLWYHPHGVHLWDIFGAPWVHVLFPERTVVAARHYMKNDDLDPTKLTRYRDIGFNCMTVSRFLKLLRESGLEAETLQVCPMLGFKPLTWLPGVRELFTTEVRCVLKRC